MRFSALPYLLPGWVEGSGMGWVLSQWAGLGNPEPINSQAWGYFPSWCSSHLLSISLFICLSQQAWNTFVLSHLCQLAASSSMSFPGGWVGAAMWLGPTSGGGGASGEILAWARTHRGSFTSGYFYFLALHISASARESDSQVSWKNGHWKQVPLHEDWTGLREGERYRTHSLVCWSQKDFRQMSFWDRDHLDRVGWGPPRKSKAS